MTEAVSRKSAVWTYQGSEPWNAAKWEKRKDVMKRVTEAERTGYAMRRMRSFGNSTDVSQTLSLLTTSKEAPWIRVRIAERSERTKYAGSVEGLNVPARTTLV